MAIRLIINTLGIGFKVNTIYQVDALVELALKQGLSEVEVAEPSQAVLAQLQEKRKHYELAFRISQ